MEDVVIMNPSHNLEGGEIPANMPVKNDGDIPRFDHAVAEEKVETPESAKNGGPDEIPKFDRPEGGSDVATPKENDDIPRFEKPMDAAEATEEGKHIEGEKAASDTAKDMSDAEAKDVSETRKNGGTYGELTSPDQWGGHLEDPPPHEVHHMPADSVNGLERNDGPAIVMEKGDHRQTASCGNSVEAREYREKQKELIDEGKFDEAMQMDIDDIHEKFGDKYDDAIAEMKSAAEEKGLI